MKCIRKKIVTLLLLSFSLAGTNLYANPLYQKKGDLLEASLGIPFSVENQSINASVDKLPIQLESLWDIQSVGGYRPLIGLYRLDQGYPVKYALNLRFGWENWITPELTWGMGFQSTIVRVDNAQRYPLSLEPYDLFVAKLLGGFMGYGPYSGTLPATLMSLERFNRVFPSLDIMTLDFAYHLNLKKEDVFARISLGVGWAGQAGASGGGVHLGIRHPVGEKNKYVLGELFYDQYHLSTESGRAENFFQRGVRFGMGISY